MLGLEIWLIFWTLEVDVKNSATLRFLGARTKLKLEYVLLNIKAKYNIREVGSIELSYNEHIRLRIVSFTFKHDCTYNPTYLVLNVPCIKLHSTCSAA